jgi:DNA-binding NtrC family response regulator
MVEVKFSDDEEHKLVKYSFQRNVRELKSIVD